MEYIQISFVLFCIPIKTNIFLHFYKYFYKCPKVESLKPIFYDFCKLKINIWLFCREVARLAVADAATDALSLVRPSPVAAATHLPAGFVSGHHCH